MPLRAAFFDFDLTLSTIHVFNSLSSGASSVPPPYAKTERGQLARIAELDQTPQYRGQGGFAMVIFGGPGRVQQLQQMLSQARASGVQCFVCTKGLVGPVRKCLDQVGLLQFFSKVYGNIGDTYGATDYDRSATVLPADARFMGTPDSALVGSKQQLIGNYMRQYGLQPSECVFLDDTPDEVKSLQGVCATIQVNPQGLSQKEFTEFGRMAAAAPLAPQPMAAPTYQPPPPMPAKPPPAPALPMQQTAPAVTSTYTPPPMQQIASVTNTSYAPPTSWPATTSYVPPLPQPATSSYVPSPPQQTTSSYVSSPPQQTTSSYVPSPPQKTTSSYVSSPLPASHVTSHQQPSAQSSMPPMFQSIVSMFQPEVVPQPSKQSMTTPTNVTQSVGIPTATYTGQSTPMPPPLGAPMMTMPNSGVGAAVHETLSYMPPVQPMPLMQPMQTKGTQRYEPLAMQTSSRPVQPMPLMQPMQTMGTMQPMQTSFVAMPTYTRQPSLSETPFPFTAGTAGQEWNTSERQQEKTMSPPPSVAKPVNVATSDSSDDDFDDDSGDESRKRQQRRKKKKKNRDGCFCQ